MPALAIGALVYRELSRRFGGAFIGGAERLAAGPVPHLGQAVPSPVRGVERELAVDRASLGHVPSLPRSGRPTPLFRAGSARRGTPGQHCPGVGECSHHSPLGCRSAGGAHYAWLSGLESPVRRHSAVVLGAVALAALVTLAGPGVSGAAGAAAGSATPAVNLLDGQTISLTGTGFDPAVQVGMTECLSGAVGIDQCDLADIRYANTDNSGSFSTDFRVTRVIDVAGTLTDCAAPDACVVGIEETTNHAVTATASISFENLPMVPPAVTVDPAANLATGQMVEVIGAGFTPLASVAVLECPANSALISDCDFFTMLFVKADGGGTVDTEYPVVQVISVNGSNVDCATALACVLSVGNVDDFAQRSVVPISFGTPPILNAGITFSPSTNLRNCRFGVARQCPPLAEQLALQGPFRSPGMRR